MRVITVICIFFSFQFTYAQYEISGTLKNYDSLWQKNIYLSIIDVNEKFSDISNSQIINSTELDDKGNFKFVGNNLPFEKSLLRIHLASDKSTVIFSARPQNYIILIANNNSNINILAEDFSGKPLKYNIYGSFLDENITIKNFQNLLHKNKYNTENKYRKSHKSEKILTENKEVIIRNFCRTSDYVMANIFALQNLNLEDDYLENKLFYNQLLQSMNRKKDKSSRYLETLNNRINEIKYINNHHNHVNQFFLLGLIILLSSFVLLLILYIIKLSKKLSYYRLLIDKQNKPVSIEVLSNREKQIIELISKNLQNKEIANILFLEVSTVKTHVSKIFQKLNIKNRKQAKQFYINYQK